MCAPSQPPAEHFDCRLLPKPKVVHPVIDESNTHTHTQKGVHDCVLFLLLSVLSLARQKTAAGGSRRVGTHQKHRRCCLGSWKVSCERTAPANGRPRDHAWISQSTQSPVFFPMHFCLTFVPSVSWQNPHPTVSSSGARTDTWNGLMFWTKRASPRVLARACRRTVLGNGMLTFEVTAAPSPAPDSALHKAHRPRNANKSRWIYS
jgi:hypothetical protein